SQWEGFGLVLLEAMARGRPIIASRVSAIPEIVVHGETGWLVSPGDSEGLRRALGEALADPDEAQRRGDAGRARLRDWFTLDRMLDGTLTIYDRVADGRTA